jgi:hypothetical protein
MSSSVISFSVDDFEVGISSYSNGLLIIIHNEIPGVGTIIKTENFDDSIETDVLIGKQTEFLELLTIQIAKNINAHSITFILAFKPEKINSFETIKNFVAKFTGVLAK